MARAWPRLAVVAVAALVTAACTSPKPVTPAHPSSSAPPPTPAPATTPPSGSGAGAHSLAGARAAALRYLGLSEAVVGMDPEAAAAAQRGAASAASAPRLVAELATKLAALHTAYPGGVTYHVGPVATRVLGAGDDAARVEIYYVGILAAPGMAPYEEWRLARYDLVWERDAWRVAGESSGRGPRPTAPPGPEPVSAAELAASLDGFASVAAEA